MEREELRQPLPDLSGVVDPRRLLHERGRPDIADGLEQTLGRADLLLPAPRDVDVAQQAPAQELAEEREPAVLAVACLDVGHEPRDDPVPRLHLADLLVDLPLVTLFPDQGLALADRDTADARAADASPDLAEVERALGVRRDGAGHLLQVEVLMQLEPLAGQDEERRLPDVQDRVPDPLEEFRDEEIRDDERRILMRLSEASKRFLQGVAVLAIELELAAAGVLGLVGVRVGEGGDDLVERGERDARRAGQIERDRTGLEARDVDGLLGDVHGVVAELLEVQRHAEDAAQLTRVQTVGLLARDALEALHLDETEQVVDLVVLLRHLLGEPRVPLEEGRHAPDELRLDEPRHHGEVLPQVFTQDTSHGSLSDPGSGRWAERETATRDPGAAARPPRAARTSSSPSSASSRSRARCAPCAPSVPPSARA